MPITIPEAIRGATTEVPTLAGTKRIRVPPGTQHGTLQRLRGEGRGLNAGCPSGRTRLPVPRRVMPHGRLPSGSDPTPLRT